MFENTLLLSSCLSYSNPSEKDWVIIELQGLLESNETGEFSGLPIGDLHFDEKVGLCLY